MLLDYVGGPVNEPFLRDTVNVPYYDGRALQYPSVRLRMDFRDPNSVGTFVYHCHLLEHEDGGMMGLIRVEPADRGPRTNTSHAGDAPSAATKHWPRRVHTRNLTPRRTQSCPRRLSRPVQAIPPACLLTPSSRKRARVELHIRVCKYRFALSEYSRVLFRHSRNANPVET